MPRVLVLSSSFPTPEDPLLGIFVLEFARAVAPHADIAVVHLERRDDVRGVSVVRDETAEFPTWHARYPSGPKGVSLVLHAAAAVAGVRAARRSGFEPDLVHAHFLPAALPGAFLGLPLVATEHWSVFLPEDPLPLTPGLRLAARIAFGKARAVLPVSDALERAIHAVVPGARTTVVRNVVDTALFHPGGEPQPGRLLSVGAFYEAKGQDLLLDAMRDVVRRRPDAHLDLVGYGDLRRELERRADGLPVTFHGKLPKHEVAELMRSAQLFVLPSRWETSGVSAIEALATGVPVVGRPVAAIPELIGDGDGVLAGPSGLAAAILEGLERDFDRSAIAARAAERYGRERIGRQLGDVYEKALRG